MKITTLVISGASSKAPIYIGICKCLLEHSIINETLDGISEIVTCSIGIVFTLYMICNISISVQEKTALEMDFLKLLNIDDLKIDNLLFENGLFDNHKIVSLVKSILIHKFKKPDITLKELYDYKPIKVVVKCINVTKGFNEYISYENYPNLSVLTLLQMTTAIPIFFKPISYNDCLYVDGGLTGGFPIECVTDNYLGFNIQTNTTSSDNPLNDIPFVKFLYELLKIKNVNYEDYPQEKIINYISNIHFTNFNISEIQKKELIQLGYEITKQHIETYKITNDLFNERPEDSDPTETI